MCVHVLGNYRTLCVEPRMQLHADAQLQMESSSMRMCMVSVIVIGSFNGRARIPVVLLALFRGAVVTMSAHHPVAPIVGLVPMAQIPIRGCCTVRQTIRKALTSVMPPTQALGSHRDHENTRTWVQLHVDVMTRPVWTTRRGLQLHLSHERNKLLLLPWL